MPHKTPTRQTHRIHKFTTEKKVDGVKKVKYCFSCTPCNIHGAEHDSRNARDKAVLQHDPKFK